MAASPPTPPPRAPAGETLDASLLAFVAGFVDTSVFVAIFGLFTAHVTGNFVLIGAALVHRDGDVLAKLLALPVFVLAVMAAVKAAEALERRKRQRIAPFLYVEAVLLVLAFLASTLDAPQAQGDRWALLAGMLATAAMGLQNALMRLELASLPSTTVMTINVTQSAIDVVTMLGRKVDPGSDAARREESRKRFHRMWPQICAFTGGAAAGAASCAVFALGALVIPAILCVVLASRWAARDAVK